MSLPLARAPGSWSAALPVSNSSSARRFFLLVTTITIAVMLGAAYLPGNLRLSSIFVTLFVRMDYWAAVSLLLILIGALLIPDSPAPRKLLTWIADHPGAIAAATAVVLCAGSLFVYQNHPLAMDEYAPVLQSQVFAAGHLSGRFPPALLNWLIPEGFQNDFLVVSHQSGAVASAYWPSFALLLAPFMFLNIPWACNPLISAATLLVIHRLALRIFDDQQTAGLAVLLTLASPVFFADGISYYSMSAHLLANSLYALLLTRPTPGRVFGAGVVGSVALTLHNPVPHLLFALPWLVWLATRPQRVQLLASIALGYVPLCALLGYGWFWFTGDLRQAGLQSAAATNMQLEHVARLGKVFGAPDESVLWARLIGVAKIWAWAVPGLLLLTAAGAWSKRNNIFCRLLVCSAVVTLAGYLFVPLDQGHGWGFRYFHSAWLALPILGAAALQDSQTRSLVVGCALLTLVFGIGFRAWQVHDFIADDLAQMPAYSGTERRVIILDPTTAYYGADLVQNDPWLRGPVIRMITRGKSDDEAMMQAHFPQMHRVYADDHGTVWSAAPVYIHSSGRMSK
jgi:hypothetical protein